MTNDKKRRGFNDAEKALGYIEAAEQVIARLRRNHPYLGQSKLSELHYRIGRSRDAIVEIRNISKSLLDN